MADAPITPKVPEMVERVGRSQWDKLAEIAAKDGATLDNFDDMPADERLIWLTQIAAGFAAMREPTEAMMAAASKAIWEFSPDYAPIDKDPTGNHEDSAEHVAKNAWQAMIDAAGE